MTHTKEPWEVVERGHSEGFCDIDNDKGTVVLSIRKLDARRIVACVNACSGIDDEMLADDCFNKMRDDRDDLLKQHDELRAALESCKYDCNTGEVIGIAAEAIASTMPKGKP
jgi:hypothetical protein